LSFVAQSAHGVLLHIERGRQGEVATPSELSHCHFAWVIDWNLLLSTCTAGRSQSLARFAGLPPFPSRHGKSSSGVGWARKATAIIASSPCGRCAPQPRRRLPHDIQVRQGERTRGGDTVSPGFVLLHRGDCKASTNARGSGPYRLARHSRGLVAAGARGLHGHGPEETSPRRNGWNGCRRSHCHRRASWTDPEGPHLHGMMTTHHDPPSVNGLGVELRPGRFPSPEPQQA